MKTLFWILAVLSIPVGFGVTLMGYFVNGLGVYCTVFGQVVCILAMFSLLISIVCVVLGIIKLRKGDLKKAVLFVLAGVIYSLVIIVGMVIDDVAGDVQFDKEIAERNEQLYGEGWDEAPAIDGIPELYQEALNKFYVAVRDEWSANRLMELGAMTMAEHYGDASLDNIGFALTDVNGDGIDELLIGTAAPVEEGGTAIFCLYSSPENPHLTLQSSEDETYYLHSGEDDGTCLAEIGGEDAAWLLKAEEGESGVWIDYREGAMDPAGRLTLAMTPFSQYK